MKSSTSSTLTQTKPVCHLCKSDASDLVGDRVSSAPESKVYRCRQCDLVYLYPIMTPDEETIFYQAEWDKYMEQRAGANWKSPESHFRSFQPEGERRLSLIRPYLRPNDSVLEVGSGTGYFLDDLRGYVRAVAGIEPNPAQRDYAIQRGIRTEANFDTLGAEKFDLICAYYVLEHFRDPAEAIKRWQSQLHPQGRLIIEVPNVDDILLGPYTIPNFAPFYWQKAHYFNFSRKTLKAVLDQAGLNTQLIPVQRYDLSNHMVWMMEGKPGGAGRFKELFTPALEAAYADMLKAQWRCDTIMAIATTR
jgi:SAM-dependent methyltransferase